MAIFKRKNDEISPDDPNWERRLLEKLATENLKEQKRSRRWATFFKLLLVGYFVAILALSWFKGGSDIVTGEHTALVSLKGVIGEQGYQGSEQVLKALKKAFDNDKAKGVILRINSPGGSPVQAGYMYDEITRMKKAHPDKPFYTVLGDLAASGGYYVAVSGSKIYADKASIVGSIGVRMGSFGFVAAMKKVGVERRVFHAGAHKTILDPFQPVDPYEKQFVENMLETIHQQFIGVVKEGRGDRLKDDPDMFTGLFWSGEQAVKLGLVDGIANAKTVARDMIGAGKIVDYTVQPNLLEKFAGKLGASVGKWLKLNTMVDNIRIQ